MAFIASLKPKSRHLAAAAEDAAQIHQKFNARKGKMNQTLLRKNCIYKPNAERCTRAEKNPKIQYLLYVATWVVDPRYFGQQCGILIRIRVKSWIRIWIRIRIEVKIQKL
jgi:hypothetical protein